MRSAAGFHESLVRHGNLQYAKLRGTGSPLSGEPPGPDQDAEWGVAEGGGSAILRTVLG